MSYWSLSLTFHRLWQYQRFSLTLKHLCFSLTFPWPWRPWGTIPPPHLKHHQVWILLRTVVTPSITENLRHIPWLPTTSVISSILMFSGSFTIFLRRNPSHPRDLSPSDVHLYVFFFNIFFYETAIGIGLGHELPTNTPYGTNWQMQIKEQDQRREGKSN